jgi:hypothetical protein
MRKAKIAIQANMYNADKEQTTKKELAKTEVNLQDLQKQRRQTIKTINADMHDQRESL